MKFKVNIYGYYQEYMQAFIISKVTYATPYLLLSKGDTKQADTIIRKAVKQTIGVFMSASTNKLLDTGIQHGKRIDRGTPIQPKAMAESDGSRKTDPMKNRMECCRPGTERTTGR